MSDLHGDLPNSFEECEVAFICGDISPLDKQANDRKMKKWLREDFKPWAEALPCRKVMFIAGNHDWIFYRDPTFARYLFTPEDKVVYIGGESYWYKSLDGKIYSIHGNPWCKQFGNWAFMDSDKNLERVYYSIPSHLDILLTHDQPYGYGDTLLQETPWNTGEHIGNKPLAEAVLEKQPNYMFCGHLHSTTHECVNIGKTKRYNVSLKDEYYSMIYEPLYLDI